MWEAAVIITMAAHGIVKVAVAMSPVQNHLGTTLIHTKAITAHTNTGIMIQNQPLAAAVTIGKKSYDKKSHDKKIHSKQSYNKQNTQQHAAVTHHERKRSTQSSPRITSSLKTDSHQQKMSRSTANPKMAHKTTQKTANKPSAERRTSSAKRHRSPKPAVKAKNSSVRNKTL